MHRPYLHVGPIVDRHRGDGRDRRRTLDELQQRHGSAECAALRRCHDVGRRRIHRQAIALLGKVACGIQMDPDPRPAVLPDGCFDTQRPQRCHDPVRARQIPALTAWIHDDGYGTRQRQVPVAPRHLLRLRQKLRALPGVLRLHDEESLGAEANRRPRPTAGVATRRKSRTIHQLAPPVTTAHNTARTTM